MVAFATVWIRQEGQAEGFGCRSSIRPATDVPGDPVWPVGGMVLCDRMGRDQSIPRLAASRREPDSATTTRPITAEAHAAPVVGAAVLSAVSARI